MNEYSFDIRTADTAPITALKNAVLYWRPGQQVVVRGRDAETGTWTTKSVDEPRHPVIKAGLTFLMALWDTDVELVDLTIGLDSAENIIWLTGDKY